MYKAGFALLLGLTFWASSCKKECNHLTKMNFFGPAVESGKMQMSLDGKMMGFLPAKGSAKGIEFMANTQTHKGKVFDSAGVFISDFFFQIRGHGNEKTGSGCDGSSSKPGTFSMTETTKQGERIVCFSFE